MCSARRCGSIDMQHDDPFRSGHDLDRRSNFQNNLSRSTYNSFDASQQEEHDAAKSNVVALLNKTLLPKNHFCENGYFLVFAPWRLNRWLRSNMRSILRKICKRAIECAFPRRCSSIGSRVSRWQFLKMLKWTKFDFFCIGWSLLP